MCDPITAFAGISAAGAIVQGVAAKGTADANAAALETAANDRQAKQQYELEEADRSYRRTAGTVRAAIGSTNLDMQSFSDVLDDDAKESALQKMAIKHNAAIETRNIMFQAEGQRQAGKNAMIASVFNAGTAFAGGYANNAKLDAMRASKGGISLDTADDPFK